MPNQEVECITNTIKYQDMLEERTIPEGYYRGKTQKKNKYRLDEGVKFLQKSGVSVNELAISGSRD